MGEAARNSNNFVRLQFHPTSCPMQRELGLLDLRLPHLASLVARGNSGVRKVPPYSSGARGTPVGARIGKGAQVALREKPEVHYHTAEDAPPNTISKTTPPTSLSDH